VDLVEWLDQSLTELGEYEGKVVIGGMLMQTKNLLQNTV
jgi:hypothetical protein